MKIASVVATWVLSPLRVQGHGGLKVYVVDGPTSPEAIRWARTLKRRSSCSTSGPTRAELSSWARTFTPSTFPRVSSSSARSTCTNYRGVGGGVRITSSNFTSKSCWLVLLKLLQATLDVKSHETVQSFMMSFLKNTSLTSSWVLLKSQNFKPAPLDEKDV